MTRVSERHGCLYVEGVVPTPRGWKKASFVVSKADISHMSRQEFEAFAVRNLPEVTEEKSWQEHLV